MTAVVDCCVDEGWASVEELLPYLSEGWRDFVGQPGSLPGGGGSRPVMPRASWQPTVADDAGDAFQATVAPAISDPAALAAAWLEPHGIELAVLTHGMARMTPAMVHPHYARALGAAVNDWMLERWLEDDRSGRLRGAIVIPEQVAEWAVEEIARVGDHPKVAAVLLGAGTGRTAGHPSLDPVYRAASEHGLAVMLYAGGDAVQDTLGSPTAGGAPSVHAELEILAAQRLMFDLGSLIAGGTFERHPELRIILAGGGFTWLPGYLWRLDMGYKGLRTDAPWLTRLPSEYVLDHVRIVAAPLDRTEPAAMERIVGAYPQLRDLVCFGSGFPGRARATPAEAEMRLGSLWSPQVRGETARAVLRLT